MYTNKQMAVDITNVRSKRRCTLYPTNALPKNGNFEVIKHFNPKNYGTSNGSELPEVGLEEDDERVFINTDDLFRPGRPNKSSNARKKNARIKSLDKPETQNVLLAKTNPPAKQSNIKVKPTPPNNKITKKPKQQPCAIYKYNISNSKNAYKVNPRDASLDSSSSDQNNDPKPNRPVRRCPNSKAKKVVDTTLDSVRNKKEIQNCVKSTLKQLGTTKIDIKMNTTHNRIFAEKSDAVQCNPRNEGYLICASYVQQLKDEIKTAKTDSKGEIYETANQLKNEIADYVKLKDKNGKFRVVTKANAEVKVIFKKNRGCNVESSDMEPSQHKMINAATSISWCEYCALSKRHHEMQTARENVLDEDIRSYNEKFICTHSFEQCEKWGFTDKVPSLDKTFTKEVPVQDKLNVVTDKCGNAICCLNGDGSNLRMDEILANNNFEEATSLYNNESTLNTLAIEENQSPIISLTPRLTREEEVINLHELQPVDNGLVKEGSDSSAAFSNLLDKAEELMQNLAIQISNYSSYESKSPKAICIDRGSSPVVVKKRSEKVLCKPCGKNVGCTSMANEDKVNVSIQVTEALLQVNVVSQGTSFNVLDTEGDESLHEFEQDKLLKLNSTENVAVQTEEVVVENKYVPVENENESADEIISETKTKLTVQQMPCISIPRRLVMQKIPDLVITSTESLPEGEILQDNNIGYVIVKHRSTEKIPKPTPKGAQPCGCTNRSKKEVFDSNSAIPTNTNASNIIPTIPSILKTSIPAHGYDKTRISIDSSVVSFNYDKKTFENNTSNGVTENDMEYFNRAFKSDESATEVICPVTDNSEEDVFERSSRLSTYIELGKTEKLKEYVRDVIKDPKTEIMFKSFQLINDKVDIDIEAGSDVDISSVDVNFYKTFVNPNGPKNVDIENINVSTASSRGKIKQQVQLSESVKPTDGKLSNETYLPLNEFQKFITSNDASKPSDSDFSEVLKELPKNATRNSYANNEKALEGGEDGNDLQQIEEDPILKVRELYQEAVRTSKKSGQFVSSHFIDITIPPEIHERFHSGRSSLRQTDSDLKSIEPFTKPPPEKSAPRMIDINVTNFLNTIPDNASIYSNTTEDVILEIDTEQLREAQDQNLFTTFPRGNSGAWNNIDLDDSEFVITHDVSLQTSLEDTSEELATTELNVIENQNKSLDQVVVLPNISYTSQNRNASSLLNLEMVKPNAEDIANEIVQRKSVKIEEPKDPIQNKTAKEVDEEESIMTFISQLTNSGVIKDSVLTRNFTPGDTQSVLSKYYDPENAETIEISTQTSNSQVELAENTTNEGQTQTDIWHAAIINPPVLPDLSKIKKQPRIVKDKEKNHGNDEVENGQHSANNIERSDPQNRNNGYPSDDSASSPIHTIHTNFNKTWESTSNSEPLTTSEKSDGEMSVKCSASIGEIHNCSSKNTPRYLRKYPQDLIVREFEKENMKIRRRKAHNRNWISYYVSKSNSPEILDETSDSIGLVRKK